MQGANPARARACSLCLSVEHPARGWCGRGFVASSAPARPPPARLPCRSAAPPARTAASSRCAARWQARRRGCRRSAVASKRATQRKGDAACQDTRGRVGKGGQPYTEQHSREREQAVACNTGMEEELAGVASAASSISFWLKPPVGPTTIMCPSYPASSFGPSADRMVIVLFHGRS